MMGDADVVSRLKNDVRLDLDRGDSAYDQVV